MSKQLVNIGLIGMGTVGAGVVEIFQTKYPLLEKKAGAGLRLKRICDKRFEKKQPEGIEKFSLLTTDITEVLNDRDIDIVVELIGGIEPARRIILAALDKGKHVVTANKAVLAYHGREIFETAKK